jgi:hypothetical protein
MKTIIDKLPNKFKWTIHNIIAHPVSEVVHLLGFTELGNKIHDCTIPTQEQDKNNAS